MTSKINRWRSTHGDQQLEINRGGRPNDALAVESAPGERLLGLVEPAVHLLGEVVADDGAEGGVVDHAPEEVLVGVESVDHEALEVLVEDELEVLGGVDAGLGGERLVLDAGRLDLVDEDLVGFGELGAEALVQGVDDL